MWYATHQSGCFDTPSVDHFEIGWRLGKHCEQAPKSAPLCNNYYPHCFRSEYGAPWCFILNNAIRMKQLPGRCECLSGLPSYPLCKCHRLHVRYTPAQLDRFADALPECRTHSTTSNNTKWCPSMRWDGTPIPMTNMREYNRRWGKRRPCPLNHPNRRSQSDCVHSAESTVRSCSELMAMIDPVEITSNQIRVNKTTDVDAVFTVIIPCTTRKHIK